MISGNHYFVLMREVLQKQGKSCYFPQLSPGRHISTKNQEITNGNFYFGVSVMCI